MTKKQCKKKTLKKAIKESNNRFLLKAMRFPRIYKHYTAYNKQTTAA